MTALEFLRDMGFNPGTFSGLGPASGDFSGGGTGMGGATQGPGSAALAGVQDLAGWLHAYGSDGRPSNSSTATIGTLEAAAQSMRASAPGWMTSSGVAAAASAELQEGDHMEADGDVIALLRQRLLSDEGSSRHWP